eukprot:548076-Rhodomonas_salina.1
MYAAVLTRPDISFAVNQCAHFISNPGPEHIAAAKRILCYLKGSKLQKLTYTQQPVAMANRLVCYADSDHTGNPDTRLSVTGPVCGFTEWSCGLMAVNSTASNSA